MRKFIEAVAPLFNKQELVEQPSDALEELESIKQQIDQLADEAEQLVRMNFPEAYRSAEAYGVFNMTWSNNRYDTTLTTVIEEIRSDLEDEIDYQEDDNE